MAETTRKDVILNIQVDGKKAVDTLANYQREMDKLKKSQKELKAQFQRGQITEKEYYKQMSLNNTQLDVYKRKTSAVKKEMKTQQTQLKSNQGSLVEMRLQLGKMTKAYDNLSASERNNTKVGGKQQKNIQNLSKRIKEAESSTNRYQRNVGNYTNSVNDAFKQNIPFANSFSRLTKASKEAGGVMPLLKGGLMAVRTGVISLGKSLLALLANPVVAILAAIAVAIILVVKAVQHLNKVVKESEDLTAEYNETLARSEVWSDRWTRANERAAKGMIENRKMNEQMIRSWNNGIIKSGEYLSKFNEWIQTNNTLKKALPLTTWFLDLQTKAWNKVTGAVAENEKQVREYEQFTKDSAQLVKDRRSVNEDVAAREVQIAKLRADAADKENLDADTRLNKLKESRDLTIKNAEDKKRIANENLRLLKIEGARTENNAEFNNKLSAAKIAVSQADKQLFKIQKSLNAEITTATREIKNNAEAEKKRAEEIAKANAVAYQKRLKDKANAEKAEQKLTQETQDLALSLLEKSIEKAKQGAVLKNEREVAALKKRLETDKTLTAESREQINEQIKLKAVELSNTLQSLDANELKRQADLEKAKLDLKIKYAKKGSDEQYNLDSQRLQLERENAIKVATEKGLDIDQVNAYYDELQSQRKIQKQQDDYQKEKEVSQLHFQEKLLQMQLDGESTLALELEQKQIELNALQQQEGESVDAFNVRKLEKEKEVADAETKLKTDQAASEKAILQSKLTAFASVTGAIDSIIQASGSKSKTMLKISKTIALANIYLSQGVAIANAIKAASQGSATVWDLIANIAVATGTVVSSTAAAFSAIKKADSAGAQKFSTGGFVSGGGSATSDSIPAQLSNGESVMNASSTEMFAPLLSELNQLGGGVPINANNTNNEILEMDYLTSAFSNAVSQIKPVVSVEDINNGNARVDVIDTISQL